MSQIFISYAREDQPKAHALVRRLEREGWDVWWDQELIPGEVWDSRIQKAVDDAKCVLVLWSTVSVKSEWVRAEAREGRRQKKLIPIRLDQVQLPMPFSLVHSGSLLDWTADPNDPRLNPLMVAVKALVEGKVPVPPQADMQGWERPGQLKTKRSTVVMLVLPALLTGAVGWMGMNVHVPTKVEISLLTSRIDFSIRSLDQSTTKTRGLLKSIPFQFIQLEHISAVNMVTEGLEKFVDTQGPDPLSTVDERNWQFLEESSGEVTIQPSSPGMAAVLQVEFFNQSGQELEKGGLEGLMIQDGTEVSITTKGKEADQLTIDAWGAALEARVTVPSQFLLDVRNIARSTATHSARTMADGPYRVRVDRSNGRLIIAGEVEKRTVNKKVIAGERIVLSLDLQANTSNAIFTKEVLPLQTVRFVEGIEEEKSQSNVQAPDTFQGHIVLKQHAEQKQVLVNPNDILVLEKLHEDFRLQSIERDTKRGGLKVQLVGTAEVIRMENAVEKRDLRLTQLERWQGDQKFIMLGGLVVVVFSTTLGAWRLWKEIAA